MKFFQRLRHSRGFGIHSPFAFRFITEVLNLPDIYGYYAYMYVEGKTLRTVFRTAAYFQPKKVCIVDDIAGVRTAVTHAVPKAARAAMYEADMVIFDAARQRTLPAEALRPGSIVLILNYKKWKNRNAYLASLSYGMSFTNASSISIIVPLPHLPRQDFDVSF